MRLLADEHVPGNAVAAMRLAGHDVAVAVSGTPDAALLRVAGSDQRIIVTMDLKLAYAAAEAGALLIRLRAPNRARIQGAVMRGLKKLEERPNWAGRVVTVRGRQVAARRLARREALP